MGNTIATGVAYADPDVKSVQIRAVLVADLPTASADLIGMRMTVSNSNAAFTAGIGATVAGGGANIVPVFCNGTVWQIG